MLTTIASLTPRPSARALFKAALYFDAVGDPELREHVLHALAAEPHCLFARLLAAHAYLPRHVRLDRGPT